MVSGPRSKKAILVWRIRMSGHYSAHQFNDAFNAKRLGNWQNVVHIPKRLDPKRNGPTEIIVDDRGHLLPHIPRPKCSSPWGTYGTCIWEDQQSSPTPYYEHKKEKQKKTTALTRSRKLPKFFKKRKKTPVPPAPIKRPQGVKPAIDPILNRLREQRLPIICMVGLPTQNILRLRKRFCEELAGALAYTYINISDCVESWKFRQETTTNELEQNNRYSFLTPSAAAPATTTTLLSKRRTAPKTTTALRTTSVATPPVSIPAQISPSLLKLVTEYDKTPDRATLAYTSHVNLHRLQSRQRVTLNPASSSSSAIIPAAAVCDPITGEELLVLHTPGNMIQFDGSVPFSRDKLMDLIKFAMIESQPTKGYIIDGIFLDEGDALCFEKMFYAPTVCTYFTESAVNNAIEEWNNKVRGGRASNPQPEDLVIDKQIKSVVQLVSPKNALRNKKYSFVEVDKLCRLYESKLIRVLNAEEANQETMHFVYSLVYKHIKNDPNVVLQEPKSPFWDGFCYQEEPDDEGTSDTFLSPLNSAISQQQADDEEGEWTCCPCALSSSSMFDPRDQLDNEVRQRLIDARLPVIWIPGYAQVSTEETRNMFCHMLASSLKFTYLKLDEELLKWSEFECPATTEQTPRRDPTAPAAALLLLPQDLRRAVKDRAHELSKWVLEAARSELAPDSIVYLLKYAMLLSAPSRGYIIDQFPVNMLESTAFEQTLYPSTSLVYLLNFRWTTNKSTEPPVQSPRHLRRSIPYSEGEVENVCDFHGFKAIKVWNAEDLDEEGMRAIISIIAECLQFSRFGSARAQTSVSECQSPLPLIKSPGVVASHPSAKGTLRKNSGRRPRPAVVPPAQQKASWEEEAEELFVCDVTSINTRASVKKSLSSSGMSSIIEELQLEDVKTNDDEDIITEYTEGELLTDDDEGEPSKEDPAMSPLPASFKPITAKMSSRGSGDTGDDLTSHHPETGAELQDKEVAYLRNEEVGAGDW